MAENITSSGSPSGMGGNINGSTQGTQQSKEQLRNLAQDMGQNIKEMGRIASTVVQDSLGQIKSGANEYYQKGVNKAQSAEKSLEVQVQSHPLLAMIVAVLVGFILGSFLTGDKEVTD
jgi:ElaB/YqjD/DUF883 family membrane-anchored ribosome-binding protein